MNRREFLELCVAGTVAAGLPVDAAVRTDFVPSPVINDHLKQHRYPRKFAYAISGNLSNNLGDHSSHAALAKFDAVILNIYPRSDIRYRSDDRLRNRITWQDIVTRIRAINSGILLGAYTVIEETKNDYNKETNVDYDKYLKVQSENWWLHTGDGKKVQSYSANCAINGSSYTAPDARGMRWPQWLAKRDFEKFFNPALISGNGFDIWFVDNIRSKSLYLGDWNNDGINDLSNEDKALSSYRGMNLGYFVAMRALAPHMILMGNAPCDLSMYPKALDASLNEAMFGLTWSLGGCPPWSRGHDGDWYKVINQYNAHFHNVNTELVAFHVQGLSTDYQLFRYTLCTCLLNNGYFNYSDQFDGYVVPPWFDEYDHDLGMPITGPQTTAWLNGVWRRDFEYGVSLVNPTSSAQSVTIEVGFRRITGSQDAVINSGISVTGPLTIPSRDGIILKRE